MKVCLMIGHWNIENITSEGLRSWRSADTLKRSTGASGERDYHFHKVYKPDLLENSMAKKDIVTVRIYSSYSSVMAEANRGKSNMMYFYNINQPNRCQTGSSMVHIATYSITRDKIDALDELCHDSLGKEEDEVKKAIDKLISLEK